MKYSVFVFATLSTLWLAPAAAAGTDHEHHPDGQPVELQLNAGKKWETDPPLRQSMAEIRKSWAGHLAAIHADKLSLKQYEGLSKQVQGAVGQIVAQCKLPPAADEQLHVIVAELIEGAGQMSGKTTRAAARSGALQVAHALNRYPQYFNDPGFKSLGH